MSLPPLEPIHLAVSRVVQRETSELSLSKRGLSPLKLADLLKSIPSPNLQILQLSNNPLRLWPPSINRFQNLHRLVLKNCALEQVPAQVARMSSLTYLNLENNHLASFPSEIHLLKSLKTLLLAGNPILRLPSSLKALTHLRRLSIDSLLPNELPPARYCFDHKPETRTLRDFLSSFADLVSERAPYIPQNWEQEDLFLWLQRIPLTKSFEESPSARKILVSALLRILRYARISTSFKNSLFSRIEDDATTCTNGIAFSVLLLDAERQLHEVGVRNIVAVCRLLRGMWTIERLVEITAQKQRAMEDDVLIAYQIAGQRPEDLDAAILNASDPAEIGLAYLTGLKDALDLPLCIQSMHSPTASDVTAIDLDWAKRQILNERTPELLINDFVQRDAWIAVLKYHAKHEYERILYKRDKSAADPAKAASAAKDARKELARLSERLILNETDFFPSNKRYKPAEGEEEVQDRQD